MQDFVAVFETLQAHPRWQAGLPRMAGKDHGPRGVFAGFDFHVADAGPQLIEINTNAGGYLLNATHPANACAGCQGESAARSDPVQMQVLEMFRDEWRRQRADAPLNTIVIVDETPVAQFLYPEFLLFKQLFESAGIRTLIAAPDQLHWMDGQLFCEGRAVDLVYNRLTDFYLERCPALRDAYLAGAVVLTPHPRAHALYADKRHLVRLGEPGFLRTLGLDEAQCQLISAMVPATQKVEAPLASDLWARRRDLFFKPAQGYGSKAAYRGDKLTRRVWDEILGADYVAQAYVPPGLRQVMSDGGPRMLKFDVRAYAYAGRIQLLAARLYEGQTTNFRTPGGGFAPVRLV